MTARICRGFVPGLGGGSGYGEGEGVVLCVICSGVDFSLAAVAVARHIGTVLYSMCMGRINDTTLHRMGTVTYNIYSTYSKVRYIQYIQYLKYRLSGEETHPDDARTSGWQGRCWGQIVETCTL